MGSILDHTFPNVPVSYNGNYSLEFWLFTEDYNDVTSGVSIIWDKHVAISVLKNTGLTAMCFPQAYLDDISGLVGNAINNKYASAKNAAQANLISGSGVWNWIRCSVSNYNKKYFINDSGDQTLKAEVLFNSVSNDYPFRYYFSAGQTTTIKVQNISLQNKKIYVRNIFAFRDYLPLNYDFRYTDLTQVAANTFTSLRFAVNYANFNTLTSKITYSLFEYGYPTSSPTLTVTLKPASVLALAANFTPIPLCTPNKKYDASTKTCVTITNCVLPSPMNANYCFDENSPLSCLSTYYMSKLIY